MLNSLEQFKMWQTSKNAYSQAISVDLMVINEWAEFLKYDLWPIFEMENNISLKILNRNENLL